MKINYKKLWIELINRDIKKSDLKKLTGLSAGTITKLNKNEPVSIVERQIIALTNCITRSKYSYENNKVKII